MEECFFDLAPNVIIANIVYFATFEAKAMLACLNDWCDSLVRNERN